MNPQTYEQLISMVSGESKKPVNPLLTDRPIAPTPIEANIKPLVYDVPDDAIYDRLSDGTYIPKYENYLGATGNEDRLAREQSAGEQFIKGLVKNTLKTFNYAIDATVGTVYGIGSAIANADFSKFYDNDFAKTLDDYNKRLDNALPNYYTDEQKSMNWLESMGTMNFWANDVLGGMAFVGGAVLPEIAIGVLTGGATFAGSLTKVGLKQAGKSFLKVAGKEAVEELVDPTNYTKVGKTFMGTAKKSIDVDDFISKAQGFKTAQQGLDILKTANKVKYYKTAGNILDTGLFLTRTSAFEAGMEARQNLKESVDTYTRDFQEREGRLPSYDELAKFTEDAVAGANAVFATNMAILSVSNAAMFGKAFNVKLPDFGDKIAKKIMGVGTTAAADDVTKLAVKEVSKSRKILGGTYNVLRKPIIEGVYEEGLQGVAGKTMQDYLEAKYNPDNDNGFSLLSSLGEAFKDQYTSNEGWKEMMIGMIIGFGGGVIQPRGKNADGTKESYASKFPGLGSNSRKSMVNDLQKQVDQVNKGVDKLRSVSRASSARTFREKLETGNFTVSAPVTDALVDLEFIKSQESLKSKQDMISDYETVIMKADMSENFTDIPVEQAKKAEEDYKKQLVSNFANNVQNYSTVQSAVESLNLGTRVESLTQGNREELREAVSTLMYTGIASRGVSEKIAKDISSIIGQDGLAPALQFVSELGETQKVKLDQLKEKQAELEKANTLAIKYAQKLAGVDVTGIRATKTQTLEKNYKKQAEQARLVQLRSVELQQEIDQLEKDIQSTSGVRNLSSVTSVADMIKAVDSIDDYIDSLNRNGRQADAKALNDMLLNYKTHSDAHIQAQNMMQRMLNSDFFNTVESDQLIKKVVGKPYKPSKEFLDALQDNDDVLDRAMKRYGMVSENRSADVAFHLMNNPELSDREKRKYEQVIRTILSANSVIQGIEDSFKEEVNLEATTESGDIITGDTIRVLNRISVSQEDMNNEEKLTEAINKILAEVNETRGSKANARKIEQLQTKLKDLQNAIEKKKDEQSDTGEYSRANEGQQEEGETEGSQREAQKQETDYSNRDIPSLEKEIEDIQKEIEETESESISAISPEDYKRFAELTKKKVAKEITDEELQEFNDLKEDIDSWTLITGTVTGGLRLSELIQQRDMLRNTIVNVSTTPEFVTVQEVLDGMEDTNTSTANNYNYGNGYYSVHTSVQKDTGNLMVTGITPEAFFEISGLKYAKKSNSLYKVVSNGKEFLIQVDERGRLIMGPEDVKMFNENTPIRIASTNADLKTGYSVVYQTMADEKYAKPMQSDYRADMNPESVYEAKPGEEVFLEIDPNNEFNKEILRPLKMANTTEEKEIEDLENNRYEAKIASDTALLDLEVELEGVRKDKVLKKIEKSKKITTLEKKIEKRKETLKKQAKKDVETELGKSKNDNTLKKVVARASKDLVINVVNTNGEVLQVLKGIRQDGVSSSTDALFIKLRSKIGEDVDFLTQITVTQTASIYDGAGRVEVEKVLLGHPTFNMIANEDGTSAIEFTQVSKEDVKKIDNIGYIENGVVKVRGSNEGIRTFFTSKKPGKIPIVVINKGNYKIAYPVRVKESGRPSTEEFKRVYESDANSVDKVIRLNKILADNGVNIKEPGEGFVLAGVSNLNNEFFNHKLAQLESIQYFSNVESWTDPKTNQDEIITEQILLNIDLSDPFHSPKIKFKFEGSEEESEDGDTSKASVFQGTIKKTEADDEAQENIDKNCP